MAFVPFKEEALRDFSKHNFYGNHQIQQFVVLVVLLVPILFGLNVVLFLVLSQ